MRQATRDTDAPLSQRESGSLGQNELLVGGSDLPEGGGLPGQWCPGWAGLCLPKSFVL